MHFREQENGRTIGDIQKNQCSLATELPPIRIIIDNKKIYQIQQHKVENGSKDIYKIAVTSFTVFHYFKKSTLQSCAQDYNVESICQFITIYRQPVQFSFQASAILLSPWQSCVPFLSGQCHQPLT